MFLILILFWSYKIFKIGDNPDTLFKSFAYAFFVFYLLCRVITFHFVIKDYKFFIRFISGRLEKKIEAIYSIPGIIADLTVLYLAFFEIVYVRKAIVFAVFLISLMVILFLIGAIIIIYKNYKENKQQFE